MTSMPERLKVILFHGADNVSKNELLAWLRGPDVVADVRTVGDLPPNTHGTVDSRVDDSLKWADKAIALLAPDDRSTSGAPNVLNEIGRWRGAGRDSDLAIIRSTSVDILSNLAGVVRIEYQKRVSEAFLKVLRFLGRLPNSAQGPLRSPQPVSIETVLVDWRLRAPGEQLPVYIVVGGSRKYDPERKSLGLKEYQSTEPVTGVVRVATALSDIMGSRFVDAVCDYSPTARARTTECDLVLVGAGDTNRMTKELFVQDVSSLPIRFEPATGSDTIAIAAYADTLGSADEGLVLAVSRPFTNVRYAVVCAGNGASGTNAALSCLATLLRRPGSEIGLPAGIVVSARGSGGYVQLWPSAADGR